MCVCACCVYVCVGVFARLCFVCFDVCVCACTWVVRAPVRVC